MANILDEQERRRKELEAQGILTRGVAGAQGGPAQMTYKPIDQRTGAEAKALGVSPQMQGQIAQEQGLIPPAALPTPAVTPSQAPAPQARGVAPQAAGVTPQAQAANQQLETAREGIGSGRAASNRRLLEKAMQVSPEIRQSAKDRMEWRMMTPQQRKEHIGLKKLEMDARSAEDAVAGASWEDIDKMSRSFADATGTAMDSYGNSFYTPDQQMFIREQRRNIDRAASEMFSNADRSAWRSPQDMYQAIASLPEVQQAGPFGQAYAFNIMRRFASPQMRSQMEADDRNQQNVKSAFLSMTREQIAEMKEQLGGEYSTMGNEDFIAEVYLNRDKDLAAGQVVDEVLGRTGRYTVENGRVVLDKSFAAQAEMREKERKARDDEIASEQAIIRKRKEAFRQIKRIRKINPERAAQMDVDYEGNLVDYSKYVPVPEAPPRELTARERIGRVKTRADANKITSEITSAAKAVQGLIPEGSEGENLVELVDAKIAELEELNSSGEMKEDESYYDSDIATLKNARDTFIQYGNDFMSLSDVIFELENIIGINSVIKDGAEKAENADIPEIEQNSPPETSASAGANAPKEPKRVRYGDYGDYSVPGKVGWGAYGDDVKVGDAIEWKRSAVDMKGKVVEIGDNYVSIKLPNGKIEKHKISYFDRGDYKRGSFPDAKWSLKELNVGASIDEDRVVAGIGLNISKQYEKSVKEFKAKQLAYFGNNDEGKKIMRGLEDNGAMYVVRKSDGYVEFYANKDQFIRSHGKPGTDYPQEQ